jgi:hypothetical protein
VCVELDGDLFELAGPVRQFLRLLRVTQHQGHLKTTVVITPLCGSPLRRDGHKLHIVGTTLEAWLARTGAEISRRRDEAFRQLTHK